MNLGTARSTVHRALFAALGAISVALAFVGYAPVKGCLIWVSWPLAGCSGLPGKSSSDRTSA
jgi:hypothetical protein